jgi:argininosuccinate lyase
MVADLAVNEKAMREAAASGYSTATDLADWLVRELGIPFREAHHVTGRAVALAEEKGVRLDRLTLDDLKSIHDGITDAVFDVLTVKKSAASRKSFGGTAPQEVGRQIRYHRRKLDKEG